MDRRDKLSPPGWMTSSVSSRRSRSQRDRRSSQPAATRPTVSVSPSGRRGICRLIAAPATVVQTSGRLQICRDPDDDQIVEAAIGGEAKYLVTRDDDLKRDLGFDQNGAPESSPSRFCEAVSSPARTPSKAVTIRFVSSHLLLSKNCRSKVFSYRLTPYPSPSPNHPIRSRQHIRWNG